MNSYDRLRISIGSALLFFEGRGRRLNDQPIRSEVTRIIEATEAEDTVRMEVAVR
jgi:hypothetical protein